MFCAKPINEWISEAYKRPTPQQLWKSFWYEGEVSCLFADTNVGKSIYALQIAESIARTQKVLYFDFEMSDKQVQLRYTDDETGYVHRFPDGLIRLEMSQYYGGIDSLKDVIDHIAAVVMTTEAKVIIIDNITWICNRCENGDAAGELMQELITLKRKHGLSILVLAHTPKRCTSSPLTQNSLAGSKRIANFMDSMFAIGIDSTIKGGNGRYVKQIKVRSSETEYGDNNVLKATLIKQGAWLNLFEGGTAVERQLLATDSANNDGLSIKERAMELKRQGRTLQEIADQLGISKTTAFRHTSDN